MNTILAPTRESTGPLLRDGNAGVREFTQKGWGTSGSDARLNASTFARAEKIQKNLGSGSVQRTALLGLLLARLEGVSFEDVSALLDVRPARLERMMHGEEQIPRSFEGRWELVSEVVRNLHFVLRPDATARWLDTKVPDLDDRTPLEAMKKGAIPRVIALTRSYRDPAFS